MIRNLVFDLDETLIHSIPIQSLSSIDIMHIKCYSSFKLKTMPYLILIRPYFYECMKYLQQHFNIGIWTSAEREYANEIISFLFRQDGIMYPKIIYYREQTIQSNRFFGGAKHLGYLEVKNNWKLNETLLIDDSIECISTNLKYSYSIPKFIFSFGSVYDSCLLYLQHSLQNMVEQSIEQSTEIPSQISEIDDTYYILDSDHFLSSYFF